MNMLQDRQNRRYLLAVLLVCLSFLTGCLIFCVGQAQAARTLLFTRERIIAGALLEEGVAQETIAAAFNRQTEDGRGGEQMMRMGRTEAAPVWLVPALQAFGREAFLRLLPEILLATVLLPGIFLLYLFRSEGRYRRAERIVRRFAAGDFSVHLSRTGEGTPSRLFAAVDDLAGALQARGEAEHKAKEFLKDTISDISHQLKTPLAALRMYHEIMEEDAGDPAVVTAFSQKTEAALERMEGLIRALLKITRLDAGGIVFEREQIPAADLIRRAMAELLTRAEKEQKTVTVEGSPEETVSCDPEWTGEAVGNLIKNALDHTSPGGRIRISWEQSPAVTRITVSDNGCGIAAEDIHHIFKRFYRSSRSLDRQGVGLGLPLARAIIEGQGGVLSVRSAPGRGAVFTVSFLAES